jgi:hypothetical protein
MSSGFEARLATSKSLTNQFRIAHEVGFLTTEYGENTFYPGKCLESCNVRLVSAFF